MPEQHSLLVNILPAVLSSVFFVLPIIGIIWLVRYLRESGAERRRLRMEVSKLAEEVSLMRKQQGKD